MGIVPMKPPNRSHEGVTAEVVEGRPVTKENIMGQAPTQLSVGLVYGVPNASHDVREGARRDYPEDLLHSSRYANSTLPQGASKVRTVCGSSRKHGSVRGCVKNAFLGARCCIGDEGGPFGAGLQERASNNRKLLPSNGGGGTRYGKGVRKSRHVRVRETNASEPLMRPRNRPTDGIKTGAPPLSGRSMAETWLLAMRCPGYRWRDSNLGSGMELENLFGGAKGKGTSGSPARPKVPIRRAGADCPVVAAKRGNARGAKGTGHSRQDQNGQLATGGTDWSRRRAAALNGWHEPCELRDSSTVP